MKSREVSDALVDLLDDTVTKARAYAELQFSDTPGRKELLSELDRVEAYVFIHFEKRIGSYKED